ncbi:hypothetical protein CFC21_031639 [Triticum aestivum]|uniref:Rad60/SUMO-like domain-containing protein n=2 Tax=Triticum aestivum TaxID=4565 RepID=A0A3B6DIK7_WHEAT|nr:hypothetical protein CFC21_031639 [Triticum aestivum]WAK97222.1 small ubiquitin-like modifier 7 [Triticum aestivum]WAK97238.1 small ubiquitin-like modifier 7 [Triticum aestivum]
MVERERRSGGARSRGRGDGWLLLINPSRSGILARSERRVGDSGGLKVVGQKRALRHTMRMDDKLQVLQDVWYHKVDVTHGTGVFMIDGSKFSAKSTPDDLELEDGDLVDFFEHMDGGALVALH